MGEVVKTGLCVFEVEICGSLENTTFLVRAQDAIQAVDLYLDQAIQGIILVDLSELSDNYELRVRPMPSGDGPAGVLDWSMSPTEMIRPEVSAAWRDALERGFDPETGAWDEDPFPG